MLHTVKSIGFFADTLAYNLLHHIVKARVDLACYVVNAFLDVPDALLLLLEEGISVSAMLKVTRNLVAYHLGCVHHFYNESHKYYELVGEISVVVVEWLKHLSLFLQLPEETSPEPYHTGHPRVP